MGSGFNLHPSLILASCSSARLCCRSLPREAGTPQLALPCPLQHRKVCETVSPRHRVPYSLEGAVPEQVLQEFLGGGGGITARCSTASRTAQSLEQPWGGSRAR